MTGPRREVDGCAHRVQHYHGEARSYKHCCSCPECTWAASRQGKVGVRRVDSTEVREHMQTLVIAGLTLHEIARRAGTSRQAATYVWGHKTCTPALAAAILAVSGLTPFGCRRRLAALQAVGWTTRQIERRAGLYRGFVAAIMTGRRRPTTRTMTAVADVYDDMWQGPDEPSQITKARAASLGYAPPMAWDDATIDDPAASPRGIRGDVSPRLMTASILRELEFLSEQGATWADAARSFGIDTASLDRRCRRHGIHRIAAQLFPTTYTTKAAA